MKKVFLILFMFSAMQMSNADVVKFREIKVTKAVVQPLVFNPVYSDEFNWVGVEGVLSGKVNKILPGAFSLVCNNPDNNSSLSIVIDNKANKKPLLVTIIQYGSGLTNGLKTNNVVGPQRKVVQQFFNFNNPRNTFYRIKVTKPKNIVNMKFRIYGRCGNGLQLELPRTTVFSK